MDGSPAWIEATVSGGGDSGGDTPVVPGSHGIIWDLVNVTSSSAVTSVSDGASLVAVLTPADGYTLGDVTVTMGGEVMTGVWNADSQTVMIVSVTGDVVISCAAVELPEEVRIYPAFGNGKPNDSTGDMGSEQTRKTSDLIDAHDCALRVVIPLSSEYYNEASTAAMQVRFYEYNADGTYVGISTDKWNTAYPGDVLEATAGYFKICVGNGRMLSNTALQAFCENDLEIYLVQSATSAEATTAEVVDADYAMDYGVAMTALVTDESASTKVEIDKAYAAVIEEAKNAWLSEANGDIDKIPLIIHTDQHSNFSKPLWDFIGEIVDWYDVGKVINLGDTVNSYGGDLLTDSGLEKYIESMESVPYSKRIEVFGNHDTWGNNGDGTGRFTPQNYLHKYFRNIYARRFDNHGNFVTYDDNYNVKYVVVSGFAYDSEKGGYSHYIIPSVTIDRIIAELEKADGYDVILLSHVPLSGVNNKSLNDLWSGRKAKTSGSVTDEYGVTHAFDFTDCDGELLCGLHGHNHEDGHAHIGELLDVWFDAWYIAPNAFHFVLVDRENRRLNVWKVDNTPQYQNYQIPFDKPTE